MTVRGICLQIAQVLTALVLAPLPPGVFLHFEKTRPTQPETGVFRPSPRPRS